MRKIYSVLLFCVGLTALSAQAQVTGTKAIGTDYTTIAAAIADLNTNGISGNVIINVPMGYTETAPTGGYKLGSATLNASVNASNTLTIQRASSTGTNPVLTAFTGTSTSVDGIFFIQGTDYVTIDGIDLAESAANTTATMQMEWGYALVKRQGVAPFDGCQNVTIQNCTITLNKTNTVTVGIYANSHTATSATIVPITATTDAMNNCVFRSNTIKNCNACISLRGYSAASPYTLYDQNNTIGGGATVGNNIQNFAGATTGSGINLQNQNNATVTYNTVNNTAGGGSPASTVFYGIYVQNGTNVSENVSNNTFNMTQGTTSSAMYELYIGCSGTGTMNLNSNTFTASGGTTGPVYIMYFAAGNSNINILSNNFYNINVATSSTLGLMYTSSSATTLNMNCSGNYTSGTTTPYVNKTGSGGTFYGYYNAAGSTTTGTTTIANNNFSNITLTGATSFYGIYENNGSGPTKFMRNNVVSNVVTNGGTSYAMALGGGIGQSISNCQVYNMSMGAGSLYCFYLPVATTDTVSNCHASNITSTGSSVYGIYVSGNVTTLRIFNDTVNTLSTSATSGNAYGIYEGSGTTLEIYKNLIYDISGTGTGSSVNGMYLNSGSVTAWNNLVGDLRTPNYTTATANSGTQLVGIYCGGGTTHNLYYNTVYVNGTSTGANFGSTAVFAATSNTTFRNNIFINTSTPAGTGMVAAYRRSTTGLTGYQAASNNNLFYAGTPASNKVIMYDGTATYQALTDYQTLVTPRDAASVTENLTFQSTTGGTAAFLKPSTTIATQIESGGINIAGITDDIYGTIRGGNTGYTGAGVAPDMGAVEANYTPLDFAAPTVAFTALGYTCDTGNRTFTATITDLSGVSTSGSLVPRVYYKKNSGAWYSNAGVLVSGTGNTGTWSFTIKTSDMGGLALTDVVSYFIMAQDLASTPNIGSTPIGAVATDVNTITTYPSAPNSYSINPALSGTYTVGAGGAFTSITSALNTYNSACLAGPVTFVLTDASYPFETYPLTILANADASATNTLTIKPAAGVAVNISGSTSATAIFKLLNAKYVTIDGVNAGGSSMTLTNNNTSTTLNTCDIWLAAGSTAGSGNSYIALKNMNLIGGAGNSTNNQGIVAAIDGASPANTAGMDNDNITISGNTFKKMGYTVRAIGTTTTSAGALDNWTISNNIMGPAAYSTTDNIGYNGMFLQNMVNVTVSGNTMQNIGYTSGASYSIAGIYAQQGVNGIVISGNTFTNLMSTGTGTGVGANMVIYLGASVINATVTGNNIHTVYNNNTSGYGVRAIIVNTGVAASNVVIANNFISDLYGYSSTTAAYFIIGIDIDGTSGGVKVYNNTVNLFGAHTGTTGATGSACLFTNTSGTGIDVRDNIFVNSYDNSSSTTDKGWAIYSVSTNTAFSNVDYNDYAVTAPNVLGYISSTDRPALTDIVTGFGGNANSISVMPSFVSSTDLHLQIVPANSALVPCAVLAGVTTDIDGTTRSSTIPVFGAHEANLAPLPPAIVYTPLGYTCTSVDRTLTATIRDVYTGVPTSGSLVPRIYYRKNTGTWYSNSGVLTSGTGISGTWSFTITATDLGTVASTDSIFYYVIAQDNSGNVGSVPSAGLVATDVNTVTSAPSPASNYLVLNLTGTVTVGTGGTYPTITAAVNAYNAGCITGAVTFELLDATYPSETFPITINANAYASATNTLTIRPAAGVAVNINGNSTATAIFKFLNAKYVTIDGVNAGGSSLTLTNNNTSTTLNTCNIWLAAGSAPGSGNSYIGLKNMNLVGGASNTTTNQGIVAGIDGSSPASTAGMDNDYITISGNSFIRMGYAIRAMGTAATSAGALDNWLISNNIIGPSASSTTDNIGYNGMFLQGMVAPVISGNTIQFVGTSTTSSQTVGIYLALNIDGAVITQNNVNNITAIALTSGSSSVCGIYLGTTSVVNTTISRNNVSGISNVQTSGYGARGITVTTSSSSNTTIANNFVSDVTSYSDAPSQYWPIGISIDGASDGVKIYNNSVNLFGSHLGRTSATGSACLFVNTTGTSIDVRDNIFVNSYENTSSTTDKGWAMYSNVTNTVFSNIDYNDYAAAGPNVLAYIGFDRTSVTDIVTGFGFNANSLSTMPAFVSNTDLHLQVASANALLVPGSSLSGVTVDIDGTTRSSTIPVIGAHEANLAPLPPAIIYNPLAYACTSADRTLTATIRDVYTGVPTTGTSVPRIYYRKNAGTWYSNGGTLSSGTGTSGTWTFTILSADLGSLAPSDTVYYYVVAQDNSGNVGAVPSAGFAATDVNTVTSAPTTPYSYVVLSLSGSYTVGSGGNYPSITAAVSAYNTACLAGPVTFVLTDATYPSETFPITINASAYASSTNTLTIKPATGTAVSISGGTSSTAIFKLLNAKYVTLDGVNAGGSSLTLTNNNTSTSCDIWLASSAATGSGNNNVSLKNMNIIGGTNSATDNQGIVAGIDGPTPANTAGMDNDNITIQGNTFTRMGYAIRAIGTTAVSAGALDNWNISNNIIGPSAYNAANNIGYNGMFLQSMVAPVISGNTIQFVGTSTSSSQTVGIYMPQNIDGAVITQNNINNITCNAVVSGINAACAVYLGSPVINTTISRNNIRTISNVYTSGYGARGIIINNAASSNIVIANNFISDIATYSSTSYPYWPIGIAIEGTSGGVKVYNNTVNLFGTHPGINSSTGSACLLVNTSTASAVDVRDNIFVNTYDNITSTTDKGWALYSNVANTAFTNIDYNDYYVTAPNVLAYIGSDRLLLTDIVTGFGGNANSLNILPTFVSSTDLHLQIVTANLPLVPGASLAGVTVDIDGTTRSATLPVIGAHEANLAPLPPAIAYTPLINTCSSADRVLTATLRDVYTGVPTSGTLMPRINYRKNAGTWYSAAGVLASGTSTNGTWNFTIATAVLGTFAPTDSIFYYVAAQDNSGNVGANPAAGFVATDVNTISSAPTTPSSYQVVNLSGTYTVGSGGAYPTISAALNAYNTGCLTGAVTFVLTDAAYPTETYPLTILANASASATNTLTIKSAAGVAVNISGSTTATAIFKLLNAKYVTIDGVNTGGSSMTLTNNNTSTTLNTCDIWLAAGSTAGSGNNTITLKNMNLVGGANNSTNNQGIVAGIDGASPASTAGMDNDNITISGNTFIRMGYMVRALGTAAVTAGGLDNWTISNNIMGPGTYSATDNIGYNGMFMQNMLNLSFTGNTIQNVGSTTGSSWTIAGLYLPQNINGLVVTGNTFSNMMSSGTGTGTGANMALYLGTTVINATITGNKFQTIYNNTTSGYGARAIILNTATAASNITIANNFISDIYGYSNTTNGNWPVGIDIEGSTGGVKVYNNTVNLSGAHTGLNAATGSACLLVNTTGTTIDVRNNIFVNTFDNSSSTTDKGWAIYSTAANTAFSTIDYNDYAVTAPNVLGFLTSDRVALSDIVTGFGGNANSLNALPSFVSATDLHLQIVAANSALVPCAPLAAVTTDIDGTTRSATIPVFGAHEANLAPLPPAIIYTPLGITCSSADRVLTATIRDVYTGVPTSGTLTPRIYYKKNATGSWYSTGGVLATGTGTSGTWNFTILSADLGTVAPTDSIFYYVVAQDNSGNVGAVPSTGFVATDVNTISSVPTTLNSYMVINLNGTYAVGTGGVWPTITAAVNAYNVGCLSGPVTFQLTDATYPTETYPITVIANASASATNTLTIKPATGVTPVISGNSTTAIFKLNGADYITFDGSNSGGTSRDMTITNTNTGTSGNAVFWIGSASASDGATNNVVKNCVISGNSSTTTEMCIYSGNGSGSGAFNAGYNALTQNSNNTYQNNQFMKAQYGVWLKGINATSPQDMNTQVVSNDFGTATTGEGFNAGGLVMQFQGSATVANNNIQNVRGTGGVSNAAALSTVMTGIYIRQCSGDMVSNNKIHNIAYTGGSTNKVHAIYAESPALNTAGTPSNNTFVNNTVYDVRTNSIATTWALSGISANGGYGDKFYFNTVNLTGIITGASGVASAFSNGNGETTVQTSNITVKDNIFVINGSAAAGTGASFYATYWQSAAALTGSVLNNNDLRAVITSGGTAYTGYNAANRSLLTDWQGATSQEAASFGILAVFVSDTDPHLAPNAINVPLLSGGTPIAGITTDMDGDTRSGTNPVIGADELNIPNCSGMPIAGTVSATAPAGCGTFNTTLSLSGATVLPGISYQWETSTDDVTYSPVSGATSAAYAATIPSTIYYRATLTCTIGGLSATTAGLQLTVNPVPVITTATTVCNGSTTTLGATVSGGTWTSSTPAVATVSSTTGVVNGLTIGTSVISYVVTATGCNTNAVLTVLPAPLALAITPGNSAICASGPAELLTALHDSVALSANFGTQQNVNTTTTHPAPFTVWYGGQRVQMLVLASELTAMGYSSGIDLTSIEMPVVSIGASYVGNNSFQVRIAPTAVSSLSAFENTGLVTVRTPSTYVATVGNNVIPFTTPYTWDGTSNLVVDLTFSNNLTGSSTMSVIQYNTNTSFPSMIVYRADGVTPAAAASATSVTYSYNARSDFKLKGRKQLPVTWTTTTGLYTDASASTAYTGSATPNVYAYPTATMTYTATTTYLGCPSTATATITVNPMPADIAGANTVCVASTTTLTNDTTDGTWSSNATGTATVGATTGIVTGVAAGVVTMTYTKTATGCLKTMQMTVNPLPASITGTTDVCESATITLANATGSGTWSSDGTSIAIVGSGTGIVTGVAAGFAQITYTLPTSCRVMQQVTVNPVPSVSVTPTPVPDVCFGGTTSLAATSTMNAFALMSQDFNAGLGAWTITNIDGNAASYWHIIPSPSGTSGATGDGTPMMQASPFDYSAITNTILTSPSFSTVGYGAVTLSFNEFLMSLSSSDATVKVEYCTDGSTWNTLIDQMDDMVGSGAWSPAAPEVSVSLPTAALGQPNVKLRWNYNSLAGLWWTIDNVKVTAAQPAPSYTWSGVSGATGLSCTSCTSTDVTPAVTGANVYSLVATTTAGCAGSVSATVNVNPLPSTIGGTLVVCQGLTTTATDADAGGTWSTTATSIATIDGTTGIVTGVAAGNAEITYTLPTGCTTTAVVTVNPLPAAIDGVVPVCQGLTTTLSDVDGGGTWGSSNTAIADIDAAGVVTGVAYGNATITYTLPTGCIITAEMTVNPLPGTIGGTKVVCEGLTTTLTDAGGGTWTSSSSAIAGIGSATGIVTGNSAGTTDVTYTLSTGCIATATVTVNHTPVAISGTLQACEGTTSTLTNTDLGGTWGTSSASIAGVDASGVVSAVLAGTATITYTLPTGCITTSQFTVNGMPAAIGGTMVVCQGVSTTLTDGVTGGTWASGATGIATVGSSTGVVTGVTAGTAPITYTMPGGCFVVADVTVNGSPAAIAGTTQVCAGAVTTLTNADPGGTWSSSATGVATISSSGVVSGVSMGTATITYSLSAGCMATTVVTVDPQPAPIAGPSQLCATTTGTFTDGTPGGLWTSGTTTVATIDNVTGVANAIASGTTIITYTSAAGCVRTRVFTVNALPAGITGPSELCKASTITMADATTGGTWSSGSGAIATINSAGVLSGVNDGVAAITYTLSTGCIAVTNVTVNPLPTAIGGTTTMCLGQTTSLTNGIGGGTWNSGTPANALVDAVTGVVTGVGVGSSVISYTLPTGCRNSVVVAVNAVPSAITGATSVCQGATTTMTNTTTGGVWTSATTTVASINLTSGVVTGLAAGTANISYTLTAGGCGVSYTITVDAIPASFTGALTVCMGQTTALGTTSTGGTWSSSNMAVATISTSGVVSGVAAGTSVITYALPSGCMRTAIATVNALPSVYNVTGGGSYCTGGSGVHIGVDNSNGAVNYQLYSSTGAVGSAVAGVSGMPVDFGFITPTGTYSVTGTSAITGCSSNMTGTAVVSLTSIVPASVSFTTSTGSDTVCSGMPVTFTATAVNGGTAPVYEWKVNGVVMSGAVTNTYNYTPSTGDVVTINMSSSIACATPSVATASRTLVVTTSVMPVVGISVMPGTSICQGSTALFNASSLYGGSAPVYLWYKNGVFMSTGSSYSYAPADGDNVFVKLVSNHACPIEDSVSSSVITMTVTPVFAPVVSINATPGTMVQTGTSVTMTATVSNGGPSPEYQWYIGTTAVSGATSATFTYSMYIDGDSVSCRVKGTGVCGLDGFNSVIMHVGATGVAATPGIADVRLVPNPNKGEFAVKGTLSVKEDKEVAIEVTNMLGQVVYRTSVIARNGNVDAKIKLDNTLANGMYMLNMISGDDRKVFHFVLEQ